MALLLSLFLLFLLSSFFFLTWSIPSSSVSFSTLSFAISSSPLFPPFLLLFHSFVFFIPSFLSSCPSYSIRGKRQIGCQFDERVNQAPVFIYPAFRFQKKKTKLFQHPNNSPFFSFFFKDWGLVSNHMRLTILQKRKRLPFFSIDS